MAFGLLLTVAPARQAGNTTTPPEPSDRVIAEASLVHLPLDPAIKSVSLSNATPEEKVALDGCLIGSFGFTAADVAAMGKVPRGNDVPTYAPLSGKTPDLKTDRAVWVVEYSGEFRLPRRQEHAKDPICILVDGETAGIVLLPYGTIEKPTSYARPKQEFRLPPLLP